MVNFEKLGVILKGKDNLHAKFNAGAILSGDVVHVFYRWGQISRASGGHNPEYVKNYISYAKMTPDGKVLFDLDEPIINKTDACESRGLEDPRVFRFEGKNYLTYTAWDGIQARVAFAEASDDFSEIRKIGIVPAKVFDKDAFLFPERIGGKIAYVHRFEPEIQIDCFDNIEDLFDENFWNAYEPDRNASVALLREQPWESIKLGGSLPPIKTDKGWLLIYHGVAGDRKPFCYRAGAALLDLSDPRKVIARLPYPILEPTEAYETQGDVDNVVFPCGGYVYKDMLYLVYGGADKVTALCRTNLAELLAELCRYGR